MAFYNSENIDDWLILFLSLAYKAAKFRCLYQKSKHISFKKMGGLEQKEE